MPTSVAGNRAGAFGLTTKVAAVASERPRVCDLIAAASFPGVENISLVP